MRLNTRSKPREHSIDILKSIAIFFVLLYHSTLYSFDFISDSHAVHYVRYYLMTVLSACVPLFFFVNGYLLFNKPLDIKKSILNNVKYIILAFIWGFITMCLLMPIRNEYFSLREIFRAVWEWKQNWINYLWFLGALVGVHIVFPLLKCAYDNNRKVFLYFSVVCFILSFGNILLNEAGTAVNRFVLEKNVSLQNENFFNMFNPLRYTYGYILVYFCAGGYAYTVKDVILRMPAIKRNLIAVGLMLVSCLGLFGTGVMYSKVNGYVWDVVWNGYDTIFTFVNVIAIYVLSLSFNKERRLIRIISGNTLGIYFVHSIVINIAGPALLCLSYPYIETMSFNVVFTCAVLFVSLLIVVLMKKIPVIKYLVK